ncbi:MAG: hypothetical protein IJ764_07660 [Bacteroidales bacterium]|nr:hypothetical protein [Bacteroidales bacterium]
MKNFFKLFSLAVLAGSLAFVSCEKDEEEDDTLDITKSTVELTFDGQSYTMGFKQGLYKKEGSWFKGYEKQICFKCAQDAINRGGSYMLDNPYLNLYASLNKDTKKYEVDTDIEHSEFYFDNEKSTALSEDIDDRDDAGNLIMYSDWTIYSVTSTSAIEFDASSMVFSATLDMNMFDEYGYNFSDVSRREDYADVQGAIKRLTLKATNITFVEDMN